MSRKFRRGSPMLILMGMALLLAAVLAPSAQARVEGFQSLAPSSAPLTAVATDPGSGLIYAQENGGKSFFVYNPQNDAWGELAPSPLDSGNNGGAAYLGGKIYVVYTSNSTELAVYDIASNSWSTIANPLEAGSGNITAGNGKLYLVVRFKFVSYDPATGITTPLAEPPKFIPAQVPPGDCDEGFEPWGGLQFDGSKIYGHQGNGCIGFAVYDIPSNTWLELPLVPELEEEGAVLGSAINPITNTYLTTGPYAGETLYRYDIEGNSWSTATLPFEIEDGGMAYVSLPGHEGVYIIQGEEGTGFTRYTEKNSTDLSPSMSAGVAVSKKGGEITYSVQVKNNGPERAGGVVLSDPLPAGTALISAGTSQGTCTGTSTLICSLGLLRSGASVNLTIKLKSGFGAVTNTATVSSQAVDTNQGNDSASVTSNLVRPCVVPKLRKLRLKKAKKALRAAHCRPGKVKRSFSGKIKKGRVVRSGKHRGVVLPTGSKVKLTVSRGSKSKAHAKPKGRH